MSGAGLHANSQKSCAVLAAMGQPIQWVESFVTPDRIYVAPNERQLLVNVSGFIGAEAWCHVEEIR